MARPAKPFVYRGWWVSKVGGVRHKLCPDTEPKKNAEKALRELQHSEDLTGSLPAKPVNLMTFGEVLGKRLDFTKANRRPVHCTDP